MSLGPGPLRSFSECSALKLHRGENKIPTQAPCCLAQGPRSQQHTREPVQMPLVLPAALEMPTRRVPALVWVVGSMGCWGWGAGPKHPVSK